MGRGELNLMCETSTGIDYDGSAPLVLMCHQPAKLYPGFLFDFALCDEHAHLAEKWRQKWQMQTEELDRLRKKKGDKKV